MGRLMSTTEVAELCGVSCESVRLWIRLGRLHGAVRVGDRRLGIPEEAVRAFLAARPPADGSNGDGAKP